MSWRIALCGRLRSGRSSHEIQLRPPGERRCSGNKYSIGRRSTRQIVGPCRPGFRSSASRTSSAARACHSMALWSGKRETAGEASQPNGTCSTQRPSIREYLKAELSLLREGPVSLPVFEERKAAYLSCTMRNPQLEDPIGLCGASRLRRSASRPAVHQVVDAEGALSAQSMEYRRRHGPERASSNGQLCDAAEMIRSIRRSPI